MGRRKALWVGERRCGYKNGVVSRRRVSWVGVPLVGLAMERCGTVRPAEPSWAMQDFRRLHVWQLAHQVALEVAEELSVRRCRALPGLRSQAIRSATSIAWNIAEGCGKNTPEEFHRFLQMSLASLMELESQLMFARDASVLSERAYARLDQRCAALRRMLISLMQRVLGSRHGEPP